jgi:NAD+ synthase
MNAEEFKQKLEKTLSFDPGEEIECICKFIKNEVKRRGVRGVVLGLSGGLDSTTCAYLCARCLPPEQIHLVSLPERDSSSDTNDNARLAAQVLNLPLEERNLSALFEEIGLYEQVSREIADNRALLERSIKILGKFSTTPALYPWAQGYAFDRREGLLAGVMRLRWWIYAGRTETFIFGKVRARMLVLSLEAMKLDCLQICTTDRSEMAVGFYDPHGDGVGDIAPLCHLYKSQIRRLARELGVPDGVLNQPSSGDLAAGLPNETVIGLRYEELDRLLSGLSMEMTDEEISAGAGVKRSMVKAIRTACRVARERRSMPVKVEEWE